MLRKTKIICTLGPSTDDPAVLRQMLEAGMNVARFNFSHGTHADHQARLDHLKALRQEMDLPVAALLDTKGPEIRLRQFENGKEKLVAGQTFTSPPGRCPAPTRSSPSPTRTCPTMWPPAAPSCWTTA